MTSFRQTEKPDALSGSPPAPRSPLPAVRLGLLAGLTAVTGGVVLAFGGPLAAAAIAMLTARLTVMRNLSRML